MNWNQQTLIILSFVIFKDYLILKHYYHQLSH